MSAPDMQLVRGPVPWWHNTEELAEFADWMDETGRDHWKRVVAKPWHFDSERGAYEREMEAERLAAEQAALEDEAWRDLERRSA